MSASKSEIISNEVLKNTEFVYTRDKNGGIQSAGYSINSEIMKIGIPIMETNGFNNHSNYFSQQISNTKQVGGKVSERFKDLAIPVGLLLMHQKPINHYIQTNSDEVIDDTLYNKLISLASESDKQPTINKQRKTKYNRKNKSNKKSKKRSKK